MKLTLKLITFMLTLFTVSCCTYYSDKEFTDYNLNKDSFDKTHIKILEKRTGLKFPRGTKGLNLFNNGNKIDPSVYAKLEIPKVEVDNIVSQLETHKRAYDTITYGGKPKLDWWTPSDKMRMNDNYYHFADRNNFLTIYIFCRENRHWILYLDIGI